MKAKINTDMFYPNDVDRITQKAGGVSDSEKNNVFFVAVGMINFFGIFFIPQFLGNFGISTFFSILIQIALNIAVAIPIFRIFVFKEKERIKEYNSYNTDSFAKFFKVGKETSRVVNVSGYGNVDVFEYDNGQHFVCLKLRYGSNDDNKKLLTYDTYKKIINYLASQELEFKIVAMDENFSDSKELDAYVRKANKSEYKDLTLRILNNIMDGEEYANIITKVIIIKTIKKHQVYELNRILAGLVSMIRVKKTAFRSIEFLNHKQYVEFAREYYGLEAIDLSMFKNMEPNMHELKDFLPYVQVMHNKSTIVDDKLKTMTKGVSRK